LLDQNGLVGRGEATRLVSRTPSWAVAHAAALPGLAQQQGRVWERVGVGMGRCC
jgi:hypothetical protein